MPASRQSRPASMNSTSTAAIVTHSVLITAESLKTPFSEASSESASAADGRTRVAALAPAASRMVRFVEEVMAGKAGRGRPEVLSPYVERVAAGPVHEVDQGPEPREKSRAILAGRVSAPRGVCARHGMVAAAARAARASPLSSETERDHEGTTVGQADVREVQDHPPARPRAGDLLEPASQAASGVGNSFGSNFGGQHPPQQARRDRPHVHLRGRP